MLHIAAKLLWSNSKINLKNMYIYALIKGRKWPTHYLEGALRRKEKKQKLKQDIQRATNIEQPKFCFDKKIFLGEELERDVSILWSNEKIHASFSFKLYPKYVGDYSRILVPSSIWIFNIELNGL